MVTVYVTWWCHLVNDPHSGSTIPSYPKSTNYHLLQRLHWPDTLSPDGHTYGSRSPSASYGIFCEASLQLLGSWQEDCICTEINTHKMEECWSQIYTVYTTCIIIHQSHKTEECLEFTLYMWCALSSNQLLWRCNQNQNAIWLIPFPPVRVCARMHTHDLVRWGCII